MGQNILSHRQYISTKLRVVAGLLTGRNTQRNYLYKMGLIDSPLCRRCGAEEETSAHVLRECKALATLRRA
jgi:ribosomal protein L40E